MAKLLLCSLILGSRMVRLRVCNGAKTVCPWRSSSPGQAATFASLQQQQKVFTLAKEKNGLRNKSNTVDQLVAPDLSGSDLAGKKVQLSTLKGKVVVLNFWGTGCGPCIREMTQLNKLVEKFRTNDKVVFLAITTDKTEKLGSFFRNRQFDYTVVNNAADAKERYNIDSLPVHILIDKSGRIINSGSNTKANVM